ncbi:MAG: hypothetical protein FWE16_01275 [Firmicutes bacterium]|nr:hypothetical protein [Bacillota bacterium]
MATNTTKKTTMQKAEDTIEKGVEEAKKATKKAVTKTKSGVKKATTKTKQVCKKAGNKVAETTKELVDRAKENTKKDIAETKQAINKSTQGTIIKPGFAEETGGKISKACTNKKNVRRAEQVIARLNNVNSSYDDIMETTCNHIRDMRAKRQG